MYAYTNTTSEGKDVASGEDGAANNQFFLLSYEEYKETVYTLGETYYKANWIKDTTEGKTVSWWLRTPNRDYKSGQYSQSALAVVGEYRMNGNTLTEYSSSDKYKYKDTENKEVVDETVFAGNLGTSVADRFIRPAFWYSYK